MYIKWSWSSLVILVILSQSTLTQNIDSNFSNKNSDKINNLDSKTKNHDKIKKYVQQSSSSSIPTPTPTETQTSDNKENIILDKDKPHSRKKRLIWVTDDGRLALPPGTSLTIAPTIALPFVRYPPDGFFSNLSISLPVTIDFDKLGLTDNQNPLGVVAPFFGRSMGHAAGNILGQFIGKFLHSRKKRETFDKKQNENQHFKITSNFIDDDEEFAMPKLPDEHKHAFHGGERAIIYTVVEDFLTNFGMDGRACLLRAICEVHSKSLPQLGLIGEMVKLFFTASKSPFSEHLDEYVSAERTGEGTEGPGECFPYYKDCPRSLFKVQKSKYSENSNESPQEFTINSENPIVM